VTAVEDPFDFDGDEWDEWFNHGLPSERLDCAGPYDAARTAGSALWSQFVLDLPHGWTIDEALNQPLDIAWHDLPIRWMRLLEVTEPDPDVSYLRRVAILVWEAYTTAPWSELCRRGTAYSLMYAAVESHGFIPRGPGQEKSAADAVKRVRAVNFFLDPPPDFFERVLELGGREALVELLILAFRRRT
jgi:hypothetical protein